MNRSTIDVSSLPKTVTRQRRGCVLNPDPFAPESSTLTTRLPSHPWTVSKINYPSPVACIVNLVRPTTIALTAHRYRAELTTRFAAAKLMKSKVWRKLQTNVSLFWRYLNFLTTGQNRSKDTTMPKPARSVLPFQQNADL